MLSAIWGSSFIFIKLSIISIPPSLLTFYRLFIASIFLFLFCKSQIPKFFISKNKFLLLAIAIFGNVIPFNLISLSEIYVDSNVASTLIGTMPLFTILISLTLFKNQKFNFLSFFGIIIGFFGMIVFINPSKLSTSSLVLNFSFLIILSAFFYGLSANLVKIIKDQSPLEIAFISTCLAAIFSLPICLSNVYLSEQTLLSILKNISMISFISATILGVMCTGVAIIIFFNLIKIRDAVFASQSNFLIPCFGSLWAFIFLEESLSNHMIFGLAFIVLGGWMVNRSKNN